MEIKVFKVGQLRTNCYIIFSKGISVVIDPGGEEERIIKEIGNNKLKFIINTHYHFDHTLANAAVKKATGAKILIHEKEKEFIDFEADQFLHDGEEIKFGEEKLIVVHTPGHSAGGICLLGDEDIFTGDTLFKGTYGYTNIPGGSAEEMQESLKKLEKIIKPGTHVYPGHGKDYIN